MTGWKYSTKTYYYAAYKYYRYITSQYTDYYYDYDYTTGIKYGGSTDSGYYYAVRYL